MKNFWLFKIELQEVRLLLEPYLESCIGMVVKNERDLDTLHRRFYAQHHKYRHCDNHVFVYFDIGIKGKDKVIADYVIMMGDDDDAQHWNISVYGWGYTPDGIFGKN